MKKILLIVLFFISCPDINFGQNYNCFVTAGKQYFINGQGYLRGMRIDSVQVSGSNTFYYPYHSLRARNYLAGGASTFDSTGGSWLGKKVTRLADGTYLFDDIWNDTVIIKTLANVGDTWMFYNDTTNVSYRATVTAWDTMTVLGVADSVKTITITADSAGVVRADDPVNNFQIKLSRNNGFVQTFDLYTFPYHLPDSFTSIRYFDYYLDLLLDNLGTCDVMVCPDHFPDTINSVFRLVQLYNPTWNDIYDFNVGDVFETVYAENYLMSYGGVTKNTVDTVISKTVSGPETTGVMNEHSNQISVTVSGITVTHDTLYFNGTNGFNGDTARLINETKMPEEWRAYLFYHYFPNPAPDTSPCYSRATYEADNDNINYDMDNLTGIGTTGFNLEFSHTAFRYQPGYGLSAISQHDAQIQRDITQYYTFVYKGGSTCYGAYAAVPSAVKDVSNGQAMVSISPNPANDEIVIRYCGPGAYTIVLMNTMGQIISSKKSANTKEIINTANVPDGLYHICITDEGGGRVNEKVIVVH